MPFNLNDDISLNHKNSISVGSRVSVERKDFISTGVVTYIEGDIIEIELSQAKYYKPGDEVKITVYSANGFLILPSSVIALDADIIMIINPPENQRLSQRRQHPRIDLDSTGTISALQWADGSAQKLEAPLPLRINNISLGGIGFLVPETNPIRISMMADAGFDIIGGLACKVEILRLQNTEHGAYVGAKFLNFSPLQQNTLRGFIIRTQITNRIKQRKAQTAM